MSGESIVPPSLSDSQKNYNRIIAWLTGLLTLLLTLFSFILSFNALSALAAEHGISIPILFPLVVEAGVIVFSLSALYRSTCGESTKWQWCLIIGSSLLAGGFNILHAPVDLVSRVMAAMPSLFLLLSFETFLGQIKLAINRIRVVRSFEQLEAEFQDKRSDLEQLNSEVERLTANVEKLVAQQTTLRSEIATLRQEKGTLISSNLGNLNDINAVRAVNKEQAVNALLDFYAENPQASLTTAGEAIGRSKSTVSNYLEELETAGRIQRNGQGVEVLQ